MAMTIDPAGTPSAVERGNPTATPTVLRRVVAASFMGTFVEWFDYAVLRLSRHGDRRVFFPDADPATAPAGDLRGVRALLHRAADRRHRLGPLRRPDRAAHGAVAVDPHHVGRDLLHRPPADLRPVGLLAPVLLLARPAWCRASPPPANTPAPRPSSSEYAPDGRRGFFTSLVPASDRRRPALRLAARGPAAPACSPTDQLHSLGLAPAVPARRSRSG